jgi:hypothetical protein
MTIAIREMGPTDIAVCRLLYTGYRAITVSVASSANTRPAPRRPRSESRSPSFEV